MMMPQETEKHKDDKAGASPVTKTEKDEKETGDELLEYKERPHPHKTEHPESDSRDNRVGGKEEPSQKH